MNGLLLPTLVAMAATTGGPSRDGAIDRVTVYPDRAHVMRSRDVRCERTATATVTFADITAAADMGSVRASASGATVEGTRWRPRGRTAIEASAAAQALGSELENRQVDLHRLKGEGALVQRYRDWVVRNIVVEMRKAAPLTRSWRDSLIALRDRALAVAATRATLTHDTEAFEAELARLREDAERDRTRPPGFDVDVMISCARSGAATIELGYMVGGASWQPRYQGRARDVAGQAAIEFSAHATIEQDSGEDWSEVKLLLSTAVPRANVHPPHIQPLRVRAVERERPRLQIAERREEIEHDPGAQHEPAPGAESPLSVSDQGLSVQLTVPARTSVASGGPGVRVFVASTSLPAVFSHRAAPALQPHVFRVADTSNRLPFAILAGPIDLFRNGDFVGRDSLARVAAGARFQVTFGVDDRLRVRRHVIKEIDKPVGLISKDIVRLYRYRHVIESFAAGVETVVLLDQIPVSELDEVAVELDRALTTPGFSTKARDGLLEWQVAVPPGQSRDVDLAFQVRYPESLR